MEHETLLWMTVITIAAGIISQIGAAFIGIPSIVPLLILGVVLGPEVLGYMDPASFGHGFETIIKLCVAIILFEAGLNLDRDEIKRDQKVIFRLVTVGGLITLFLTAVFSKLILGLSWSLSLLFGSLVIVTGPTVIQPLMRRVNVGPKLRNILESEGIFIDPIGAIIAIFVLEVVLQESSSIIGSFSLVFLRLGIGAVIGIIGGYIIGKFIMKWSLVLEEIIELMVLAAALSVYAISESVVMESGLMATVACGAVLGHMEIPQEEPLKKFKGKLSIFVISFLFILLASSLKFEYITTLGVGGLIVVFTIIFITRPVEIFLTTFDSDLNLRQKLFLSYISPRGIVAASISSIIAIELGKRGFTGGEQIQGLVFLTIGITVLIQGLTANRVAGFLNLIVEKKKVIIVGANSFGRILGKLLKQYGKDVGFIDTNDSFVRIAEMEGFEVFEGSSLDVDNLEKIGITEADNLVSVTTSNKVNTIVCRLAKTDYKLNNVFPLLVQFKDILRKESVSKLGLDIAFGKLLNLESINPIIASLKYILYKVNLDDSIIGKNIEDLNLPENIIPLLILRGKKKSAHICRTNFPIMKGDEMIIFLYGDTEQDLANFGFNKRELMKLYF
jgi:NhaP-type Na+/H+ or K+/H+ antiporter/Trk K+ transport system NAD-binding subunit